MSPLGGAGSSRTPACANPDDTMHAAQPATASWPRRRTARCQGPAGVRRRRRGFQRGGMAVNTLTTALGCAEDTMVTGCTICLLSPPQARQRVGA